MNAPDKIYVSHLIYDTWQYTTPNLDDELEVEYIRKDALLEWLKERRAEHSFEVRKAYQRTIEKIESL